MAFRNLLLLLVATVLCVNGRRAGISGKLDPEAVACDQASQPDVLNQMSETFGSPNYPNSYGNQRSCEWSISYVADGHDGRVVLSFTDFNTETGYDYVYIVDGADGTGEILGEYSGSVSVPSITSTRPGLFILFQSDNVITDTGFQAVYTADPACFADEHSNLTGDGSFNSPFYPLEFTGDLVCDWIVGTPSQVGVVQFETFNVGSVYENHCRDAVLYFTDDVGYQYLCGADIPADISFVGEAHFHFSSPMGYVAPAGAGFLAHYTTGAAP